MNRISWLACLLCMTAVALAQKTFTITDYTARGFAPDLVQYTVKLKPAEVKKARVFRNGEQPVAAQVSAPGKDGTATLSFVADVPPNGTSNYTLTTDGAAAAPTTTLAVTPQRETAEIATALLAVRVPLGKKTFKTPVAANTLPAPILAFRSGGPAAAWLGSSKVLTDRPVRAWSAALVEQGPVFATVQYEIQYAEGGYYRSTITVIDGVPVVKVRDEYDLGSVSPKDDLWELCLSDGWTPDMGETAQTWGNGGVRGSRIDTLKNVVLGDKIQPYGALGSETSQVGLWNAQEAKDNPKDYRMAGVVPLHHGNWRRIQQLPVVYPADRGRVAVQFPMTRSNPRSDTNPYFVGTHEDSLPVSYARREWALALGHPAFEVKANWGQDAVGPFYQLRLFYGVIGLDRYKDYITDWPDTNADYPRVFVRKSELPRIKEAMAQNPALLDQFKGHYYFRDLNQFYSLTGNPDALKAQNPWPQQLQAYLRYLVSCPTPSHHMTFEMFGMLPKIEDTLACPDLKPEERKKLRAQLAVLAYEMVEPDAMGNGNGAHTGNPNMSIARQMPALDLIALLPDHPMYAQWRDFLAEYLTYKFGTMMTPGGAWFEPGGYQMWAYGRIINAMSGVETMQPKQTDQLYAYHTAGMDYLMNQIAPVDVRYGARMHPGFGNSGPNYFENYFDAAMNFATRNPQLAGNLLWTYNNNGKFPFEMSTTFKPWVQPQEPKLVSRVFPGFGVIFRAHQGPDETYLMLRSGYDWSHWYIDQGNMVLFSKGAILLPYQPFAYYDTSPNTDYAQYNLVRFGDTKAQYPYGWPDSNVLDYYFGQRVQYAWASAGYPAGDPKDEFGWDRQVAFMVGKTPKSPNYFVFHDTYSGKPMPNWFFLNLIGRKGDVAVNGQTLNVHTEFPTQLDLLFTGGKALAPEMAEDNTPTNFQAGRSGMLWAKLTKGQPTSPNWKQKDGTPATNAVSPDGYPTAMPAYEQHVLLRLTGEQADDRFWVAYPRGAGEAAPKVERLAPNVVKITHAEGTDYVLLTPGHDKWEGEGVVLEGSAAAVRVSPDGATCALMSGAGRVGYQGSMNVGVAPFEKAAAAGPINVGTAFNPVMLPEPVLTGHADVAPGVKKADDGKGTVEYLVNNAVPVHFTAGDVTFDARMANVVLTPGKARFIVPGATYAKLVAGTKGIRGFGPFDITITDTELTGTVDGKTRTLVASRPRGIRRPSYYVDDVRWHAGFEEEWNRPAAQMNLAFGFTDGKHAVRVVEWASPSLPPAPARAEIK